MKREESGVHSFDFIFLVYFNVCVVLEVFIFFFLSVCEGRVWKGGRKEEKKHVRKRKKGERKVRPLGERKGRKM